MRTPALLAFAVILIGIPWMLHAEPDRMWVQQHGFSAGILSDWKWMEDEFDDWMENLAAVAFGYSGRSYLERSGWGFRGDVQFLVPFALVQHYDGERTTANRDRYDTWWGLYNFLGGSRSWVLRQGEVTMHVDAGLNHFFVIRSGRTLFGSFANTDSSLGLALGVGLTRFLTENLFMGASIKGGVGIARWNTWTTASSERTETEYFNSVHVMPSLQLGVRTRSVPRNLFTR